MLPTPGLTYVSLQPTSEGQAAHAHVHEIVNGLRAIGYDVNLVNVDHGGRQVGTLTRIMMALLTQARAIRVARSSEMVYLRGHFLLVPLVLVLGWARIPFVVEVNGPDEDAFVAWPSLRRVSGLVSRSTRWQLNKAAGVVVVTSELADWVRHRVRKPVPIATINNGANTKLFHPEAAVECRRRLPEKYVVFFGALAGWQGVETMLAAVREVDWPGDVALVVVGDGTLREAVSRESENNDLVHYLGQMPYNQVPGIVARSMASLIVKRGHFEKTGLMPLKLFESMACAVPVIVSDYPGMADLVSDKDLGEVVPPGDSISLSRAVARLYQDDRGAGARARAWVEQHASWTARSRETAAFIDHIRGRAIE